MKQFDVLASQVFGAHHTVRSESQAERSESPLRAPVASTAEANLAGSFPIDLTSVSPDVGKRELDETTSGSSPLQDIDIPAVGREYGIEAKSAFLRSLDGADSAHSSVQLETKGTTQQKKKVVQGELWRKQTIHKNTVAVKLREVGYRDIADKLELCHSEMMHATCTGCGKHKTFMNRCEKFYCPECQPTLAKDRAKSVGWWSAEMRQPKHVVLTLKNFPRINKRVVTWAKKAFRKLRHRKFCSNWEGGFYNWEVTNEGEGWHLHVHVLVEAKWIDSGLLSSEWMKVTRGLGRIVKVMDARRVDYLKEVTKYAVKGSQLAAWNGHQIAMFINAFEGVRTFGVFGSLYGKRTEFREWIEKLNEKATRCECGCDRWLFQPDDVWQLSAVRPLCDTNPRGPNIDNPWQLTFKGV